ncbi:Growth-regulating factor 4 [Platanthera guangdongensis]|uniref:Growth-regulating factor 4 n=1 Tax=Platanthera guangdongensis TaxID=2320717 RepID=A0ABR2MGL1_9ASPA
MHSSFDNPWRQMPSTIYSFPPGKEKDDSFLHGSYLQLQPMQDLRSVPASSLHHNHHQHSLFGSEFNSLEPPRKSVQPLLPFFDEWPRTRNSWSDLEDERANQASFATTQLSISIPMVSSDFSTTTSLSQNGFLGGDSRAKAILRDIKCRSGLPTTEDFPHWLLGVLTKSTPLWR